MIIPSYFLSAAKRFANRIAFNWFDGSWRSLSYSDLLCITTEFVHLLGTPNENRGKTIAIVMENRPEWCAAYLAIVTNGAIAVPLDIQLGPDEIRLLLEDSGAETVFCSTQTEQAVKEATSGSHRAVINVDSCEVRPELFHHDDKRYIESPGSPDDIASLIYTSGTTGIPKGVMLTHHNFCSDVDSVAKTGLVSGDDNFLSLLPYHHSYPFMCTFLLPLFIGACVTFAPGLKSADLIGTIRDKEITIVVGVPRLLEMIRNGIVTKIKEKGSAASLIFTLMKISGFMRRQVGINIGRRIFSSIHQNFTKLSFFASGGARLEPSVMGDLEAFGFTVLEGYGLTETSPIVTFTPMQRRKPGSAGKPLPGVEMKTSEDGEILVKGPMVMKGYYRNETATNEVIREGWFCTGDLGFIDAEGYVFITGRKKEVIVLSSGKNIYPDDIERVYLQIPLIKEICVIGMGHCETTESIHAVIVPDFDYARSLRVSNITEQLRWKINEISMKLPQYMRVKGFTLSQEALPRTPLGKVRRFMVRGLLRDSEKGKTVKGAVDASFAHDKTALAVVRCIVSVLNEEIPLRSSHHLELDLGFDSLKRIELLSALELEFSLSLPESFMAEVQTVEDIIRKIRGISMPGTTIHEEPASLQKTLAEDPPAEFLNAICLSHSCISGVVRAVLFVMVKCLSVILFRLKTEGRHNMPQEGPFIIAPNHTSYLDGFMIASSVTFTTFKNLYFQGFQGYFNNRFMLWIARLCNIIPIDSDTYLNRALQLSSYVLRQGKVLCVFPEGGRSFDGMLMEFKKGIGTLTVELGVPVIPAAIKGTFEALPRGARFIRLRKVKVVFGAPVIGPSRLTQTGTQFYNACQSFADDLKKRVSMLLKNG